MRNNSFWHLVGTHYNLKHGDKFTIVGKTQIFMYDEQIGVRKIPSNIVDYTAAARIMLGALTPIKYTPKPSETVAPTAPLPFKKGDPVYSVTAVGDIVEMLFDPDNFFCQRCAEMHNLFHRREDITTPIAARIIAAWHSK